MPAAIADAFVSLKLGNSTALKAETATALEQGGIAGGKKGGAAAGAGFLSNFRKEATKGLPKTSESIGQQLGTTLGKASKYGALALVGVGVASLKMAADFQKGLTTLVTGAGESEKNLALVGAGIKRVAVDSGTSTKTLIDGMYMIESAGFHGAAGLKILSASAQGAKLSNADLGTTANAVTTVMKDYGLRADQAVNATNALVVTVSRGKTHLQDLASSMARLLPTASALGIDMGQVGGAMATMTGEGTSARLAAQGLNATIIAMAAPTSVASKAMNLLGLGTKGVAQYQALMASGNTKAAKALLATGNSASLVSAILVRKGPGGGLIPALAMVNNLALQAGARGSPAWIAAMKAMLGGTNGLRVGLQLTGKHMTDLQANTTAVSKAFVTGGKNVIGWSLAQKDASLQFDRFKEILAVTAITIGQKLLPVATEALGWLIKTHMVVPLVITVVGLLTAAFIAQAVAMVAANIEIFAIIAAVAAVIVAIVFLKNKWGTIWQWIRDATASIVDKILGLFGTIIHAAADAFGWIPGLGGHLRDAAAAFDRFKARVNNAIRGIQNRQITVKLAIDPSGKAAFTASHGVPVAPGAARGLFVRTGTRGVDDQLIRAQVGELVVPTRLVDSGAVDHLRGMIPGFAQGGRVGVHTVLPGEPSIQAAIYPTSDALIVKLIKQMMLGMGGMAFSSAIGRMIAAYASSFAGRVPYVWGGTTPGGWDCSGFTDYVYNHFGFHSIPRVAAAQQAWAQHTAGPHMGGLVFFGGADGTASAAGHVGIITGSNRMVNAYGTGFGTIFSPFSAGGAFGGYGVPPGSTKFHRGGVLGEPLLGLGLRSGSAYQMNAGETVTSEHGLAQLAGLLSALIGAVYDNAGMTAAGVAGAIAGAAHSSSHRAQYSTAMG